MNDTWIASTTCTRVHRQQSRARRRLVLLALLAAVNACGSRAETTEQRLLAFKRKVLGATEDLSKPTPEETALLQAEQIDVDRFTPSDAKLLAELFRLGRTLKDSEMAAVAEFGTSEAGFEVANALATLLIQRKHFDEAARVLVTGAAKGPRENRSYATWKWLEWTFGSRSDYRELSRTFSLALLRRFESGNALEREVVGDMFDLPTMTDADLTRLRARLGK